MTALTVPATDVPSEPNPWVDLSDELHKLADDVLNLVGEPAPKSVHLYLQPHCAPGYPPVPKGRAETMAAVDMVSSLLLGRTAKTQLLGSNSFHHTAHGERGPISISIFQQVADPAAVDQDDEIARLRAENEELRAAVGLDHSREQTPEDEPPAGSRRTPPHFDEEPAL